MRRAILPALWAVLAFGAATGAERPVPAQACAALDLHVVMLLEEHGHAADLGGEELLAVVDTLLEARRACRAGRFADGIGLYERLALAPVTSRPLR